MPVHETPKLGANPVAHNTWVKRSPPVLAAVVVTPQLLGGWVCSRLEGVEPSGAVLPP